ncbi:MAG: addiction module antidote protein, HigA family [Bacteroidetes bacterium RIFCSPLOWO2_12_FULL_31_6]|nr:MAG: addiction module antidote protein, HigA family [Bacteroidetes bacterium RIFCSPLOWO2_12_FULL_31_6]
MEQVVKLRPARKFGPGYFIKEQMEYRSWTQEDLSEVIGMTIKHVNRILQDKQPITLDTAKILAEVFETSPQYWLNLDANYRLWLSHERTEKEIEADLKGLIYERMPVKDMLTKGWLKPFGSAKELKQQVLQFWNWTKLDFSIIDENYLPYLPRKSEAYNQFNASYAITWYRKATIEATKIKVNAYDKKKLENLYDNIYTYTVIENGINLFIKELANAGVIFFVLPHLQKTYLDGAAFFLDKTPVIVYTGRFKRIDNFWFTVAHEIAHVLLHLNKELTFVLDNLRDGELNGLENEANEWASNKLKHEEILNYLNPYLGYLTTSKVEECAATYNIHPAIIIGKLAHEKTISYANQSLYNDNVLHIINAQYQING